MGDAVRRRWRKKSIYLRPEWHGGDVESGGGTE